MAFVNFFTKTLPSIFIHSKEEKNSAELQGINGDEKSTVARIMKKLASDKAQKLLEKPTSVNEQKGTVEKEQSSQTNIQIEHNASHGGLNHASKQENRTPESRM